MGASRADLMGTRHTLNITYPTPQETLAGSPTLLPTSEPATATFSYTVAASDLPTFDGVPFSQTYLAILYAGGKNTDAGSARTLCYRIKKNGSSIATATNLSVTADQYWTITIQSNSLKSIAVGDVIDVFLWQVTTNALNWDYQAFACSVTNPVVDKESRMLKDVIYTLSGSHPSLTSGNPSATAINPMTRLNSTAQTDIYITVTRTIYFHSHHSTYKMYGIGTGDGENWQGVRLRNHASYRPYYYNNNNMTKIEWTPTNVIL